jgi:hypothetical protein
MAKEGNAIYAPGELSRVRDKLGVKDQAEAKRMADLLGGEVGTERYEEQESSRTKKNGREITVGGKRPGRRVDIAGTDEEELLGKASNKPDFYPEDDPSLPLKLNYRERIKMDQLAGQLTFEIKNSIQVLISIFSFFRTPVDYVNPRFVTRRMNEYYHKIEKLVTAARNLFPKNNTKRNRQLKRASPFVYNVLDTIREWNIEEIGNNMSSLQSRPRSVVVTDFAEIVKNIYRPLCILSGLNTEHLKSAFKLIYKVLYIESPMDAKERYQDVIRNIIMSLVEIRRDVQFGMYPLLMKLLSSRFLPYERFFIERRRRYMAFLNVTGIEQLDASELSIQQIESVDMETLQHNAEEEQVEEAEVSEQTEQEEKDPDNPQAAAPKSKEDAETAEQKAMEHGQSALEALFPKAGWDKLNEYPDLFPYFANIYNMKHGYELIAPTDPLQQISVLMQILDDLFIGLRHVNFGIITNPDGSHINVSEEMIEIINNWRRYIEDGFTKDYLPRLMDYCRMLENSEEARGSVYAKKILNELHWIKRLYFLPYYRFESLGPPPFQKQDVIAIYSQIRKLRINLTAIAMGIEQGTRTGGASVKTPCDGINNPWETWNFPVPNPISRRLDMMLPQERKINATLIFFSLSAITVLDYIVNNENSWSYEGGRPGPLFRSVRNEGITPLFGVDKKLDADKIFRESLKKNEKADGD